MLELRHFYRQHYAPARRTDVATGIQTVQHIHVHIRVDVLAAQERGQETNDCKPVHLLYEVTEARKTASDY